MHKKKKFNLNGEKFKLMTKIIILTIFLLLHANTMVAQEGRVRYTLNDAWQFLGEGVAFGHSADLVDDTSWEQVNLPHTWNAEDPFDDKKSYRRGVSWYRKNIKIPDNFAEKRIFLRFEGANQVTDLYVNGAFVGRHKGGYTAFNFDITEFIEPDLQEQLLAVQVSNATDEFIPPLSVGYALYGGIYRDVWLIATNNIHFDLSDHGSNGVYISTPIVNRENATVEVKGNLLNETEQHTQIEVVSVIKDENDKVIASSSTMVEAFKGKHEFTQQFEPISQPELWSPSNPYLYTISTQIKQEGKIIDEVTNPLGFRWFSLDPKKGFFLNGKHLPLRGTNRHQDFQGKGSALSNADHIRDLKIIKEMGSNFLRLAHYPQDPQVLKAADELGLIIWEEIPLVNYMTIDPEFYANAENMIQEMIRQHYNHPSVILWGSMNEVFLWSGKGARISSQEDTIYTQNVQKFAVKLDSVIRAEDPHRYSAMALHMSSDYERYNIEGIAQAAGFNVYSGWYGDTFDGFGRSFDRRHERNPDQIIFISEYGAGSDLRLNSTEPKRLDFTGQYQRMYHESYLRQINARPYLVGTAIWSQFDFSQPHTGGSIPHLNQKGMLTWDRQAKDVYYLYKANWNKEPMVYIATRDWLHRAGADSTNGEKTVSFDFDVYTNLDQVKLSINGKSLGTKKPDDIQRITWNVPLQDGDNILMATGKKGTLTIEDRVVVNLDRYSTDLSNGEEPFTQLMVNVGSNAQFRDDSGVIWIEDRAYSEGSFGYIGGTPTFFPRKKIIRGTHQEALYYTYRDSLSGYKFDVPEGNYEVELHFIEPEVYKPGERVFDISVNDRTIINDFDLYAEAGFGWAINKSFNVTVEGEEGIDIKFNQQEGAPLLSGIKVIKKI